MDDDLLKPSLQDGAGSPIYSTGALLAAAFFGGGLGVVALATENSRILRQLRADAWWLLLGALVSAAGLYAALRIRGYPDVAGASSDASLLHRAIGLALVGVYFYLHRHAQRAMRAFGLKAPGQIKAAVAAVLFGYACNRVLEILVRATPDGLFQ